MFQIRDFIKSKVGNIGRKLGDAADGKHDWEQIELEIQQVCLAGWFASTDTVLKISSAQ